MKVRFVLVETLAAGNLGSAARALENLGFDDWRLVRPVASPEDPEAVKLAVDAADLLRSVKRHEQLDEALAGCSAVVGMTRRAGKHRWPHLPIAELAPEMSDLARTTPVAFVFGREDHGLADRDLDRCTHLSFLPSSPSYPSFNLAQALLLTAWELRRGAEPEVPDVPDEEVWSEHREREAMYEHLQRALETIGYLHRDSAAPIMRRFRRLLGRKRMTEREVALLRGLARQILWLAERADLAGSGDP